SSWANHRTTLTHTVVVGYHLKSTHSAARYNRRRGFVGTLVVGGERTCRTTVMSRMWIAISLFGSRRCWPADFRLARLMSGYGLFATSSPCLDVPSHLVRTISAPSWQHWQKRRLQLLNLTITQSCECGSLGCVRVASGMTIPRWFLVNRACPAWLPARPRLTMCAPFFPMGTFK